VYFISFKNIPPRLYRKLRSIIIHEKSEFYSNPYFVGHSALNRKCRKNEIVLRKGLTLNIVPDTRFGFEYFCFRDEDPIKEFDCFLTIAAHKNRLLDVGALHGIFSLSFTVNRPDAKAVAIDPSPKMHFEWEHLVVNADSGGNYSESVIIAALTGDAVCAEEGLIPDLIKIDIEGYEWQCLDGLKQTIDKQRPMILLEIHPVMLLNFGKSPSDLVDFFDLYNYCFFNSAGNILSGQDVRDYDSIKRIIAAPAETGLSFLEVV